MPDVVDEATRSRMMAGIKGKNTKPEMILRRGLHALGFRFRLHRTELPGRPDLVFPSRRVVVFVHGCFWHAHDCKYFKWPGTNVDFWRAKITKNVERDADVRDALRSANWKVLEVWECELRQNPLAAIRRVATTLKRRAPNAGNGPH